MKFTNQELQKTMEVILESKVAGKHVLPIKFETQGRKVVPVLQQLKPVSGDKGSKKKYEVKLGAGENELALSMSTETLSFIDGSGQEQKVVFPCIDMNSPKELFEAANKIGEMFLAIRTAVLLTAATNKDMVEASSLKPATGIVLADMLVSEGRIQQSAIRELIENSEFTANGKINQAIAEHQNAKAIARVSEVLGYTTAKNFTDGCLTLASIYDKLTAKTAAPVVAASDAEPTIAIRKEGALEQIERTEQKTKTYGNLL